MPDVDFLPGMLLGDLRTFHHQTADSLTAVVFVSRSVGVLANLWKLKGLVGGIWGDGLYLSHVLLDFLVNDPSLPLGVQLLWPLSKAYFIAHITPFASFDYYDPEFGVLAPLLSVHNLSTIKEIVLMAPLLGLAWLFGKYCAGPKRER